MIADNRYKVLLWHSEQGVAKIETFYADDSGEPSFDHLANKPYALDEKARALFEKDGWEFMEAKFDGPSRDARF
jgi:hypothetical protein